MSLTDFSIYPPATVILDDGRDADQSWRNHEARYPGQSNRGGVDVVAPVGTPVYAWADGIVERQENNGSAGNVARLHLAHNPGWKLDYKHLSGYANLVNGIAKKGQLIGYSGRSGGVAPHVHYNLVDPSGTRQNPWHYVSGAATAAPIPAVPIVVSLEDSMEAFEDAGPAGGAPAKDSGIFFIGIANAPKGRAWRRVNNAEFGPNPRALITAMCGKITPLFREDIDRVGQQYNLTAR